MTLANRITMTRAVLAIIMYVCILIPQLSFRLAALILLVLAGFTDWIDGVIARRTGSVTPFGAIADPFVDKILVMAAFLAFLGAKEISVPAWSVFIILAREFMISSLRVLAALHGEIMSAEKWGKWKTCMQFTVLFIILGILSLKTWLNRHPVPSGPVHFIDVNAHAITWWLSVFTAAVTMASGLAYLYTHKTMLRKSSSIQKTH
ncbi:MAG: CDP-diacylglycerol--glycerol-3-phosphate 3-phosphatidyltransferase [bacterium]